MSWLALINFEKKQREDLKGRRLAIHCMFSLLNMIMYSISWYIDYNTWNVIGRYNLDHNVLCCRLLNLKICSK